MGKEFPERLRKAREQRGLNQTELAERAGLQPSAVSHFETGRRAPSFDNLKKLSDALSVSVDFLLGKNENPATVGPQEQKLFRDFAKLTDDDRRRLEEFAAFLAAKKKE